jgi:hypothetical protein
VSHIITRDGVGSINLTANRADSVYVDVAWSNSMPANLPESPNGSTVLDIGRGVKVRASVNLARDGQGWKVSHLSANQYPSRRDLTRPQQERLTALLVDMVGEWARDNAEAFDAAERRDRETAADTLRKNIQRHEQALAILRAELNMCEAGGTFNRYPDLPTDRR